MFLKGKNPKEGDRNFAEFIPMTKISSFKKLHEAMILFYGTAYNVDLKLECGQGKIASAFKSKRLSTYYAKKILAGYNEMKKSKANK
ncbi:hypothetical protein JLT2_48 [Paraglaciecola Antarctic JLT virus 2]|nr:hypothetical protein JLT2_48 [Paraglaciecola Antarctic JLT virus 2]